MNIVIFAAGAGTRMKSNLPKPLHLIGGQPILKRIIDVAKTLNPAHLVVVGGFAFDKMQQFCASEPDVQCVFQKEQVGTADALLTALDALDLTLPTLTLVGDAPLIRHEALMQLKNTAQNQFLTILSAQVENPQGYGRIVRDAQGDVLKIVEEKEALPQEKAIQEINTGVMVIPSFLLDEVSHIDNRNTQKEKYLTDLVAIARQKQILVKAVMLEKAMEGEGINDKVALAKMERYFQTQQAQRLMQAGLTLLDPQRFDLRGELIFGKDVTIDVGAVLEGKVELGDGVHIGAYCVLKNVTVGKNAVIEAFCHLEQAQIGENATVGPYARLRPGAVLEENVHVGNFVEIKQARLSKNTKAGHLSYLGDAQIGENVNVGAGTITCNYDGVKKSKTIIQQGAFIGSGTQLVAPVEIGENALIAAGSTITKNAPADSLTHSRTPQKSVPKRKT